MSEALRIEIQHGVAELTLNRPEVYNALDEGVLRGLADALHEHIGRQEVRALLLTGAGPAFCAGGDVRGLHAILGSQEPAEVAREAVGYMHEVLLALFRCPKPVLAAVNGPTAGAGLGLMLTADMIWAARSAHFTVAFTAIGASPDGGTTYLLPRAVGPKMAAELALTNRRVGADEALSLGLVTRVLDDDQLLDEARQAARSLAAGPIAAFGRAKQLLRTSLLDGYAEQLDHEREAVAEAARGEEFREGVRAFLEKRPPRFL